MEQAVANGSAMDHLRPSNPRYQGQNGLLLQQQAAVASKKDTPARQGHNMFFKQIIIENPFLCQV